MAAPEKVNELAGDRSRLTLLEMLDLLETRIGELRPAASPKEKAPANVRPKAVPKGKTQRAKKKLLEVLEKKVAQAPTDAKKTALAEASMHGKRQALGKSLLQLRGRTTQR